MTCHLFYFDDGWAPVDRLAMRAHLEHSAREEWTHKFITLRGESEDIRAVAIGPVFGDTGKWYNHRDILAAVRGVLGEAFTVRGGGYVDFPSRTVGDSTLQGVRFDGASADFGGYDSAIRSSVVRADLEVALDRHVFFG